MIQFIVKLADFLRVHVHDGRLDDDRLAWQLGGVCWENFVKGTMGFFSPVCKITVPT